MATGTLFAQTSGAPLASLIEAGNRKAALTQISAGADVNAAQPDGTRPVHWAIYHVDYELIEALLAKKASVNVKNEFGLTPIAEAAELGDPRMVKMLLGAGADVEGANADGETALMLAIRTGEVPVVDLLIKAGANVNTVEKFHNQTPLMWAATAPRNAGALVRMLLAKGADLKPRALYTDWPSQITAEPRAQYRPVGGLTAFLYAARDGCLDCVNALLEAGANINQPTPEGVTPLMLALDNDHDDVASLLLKRGANPGVWDWWGRTALYILVDRRAAPVEAALKKADADHKILAPADYPKPSAANSELLRALLATDVDLNPELTMHRPGRGGNGGRFSDPVLNTGCTPLMRASMVNDLEAVRVLLDKGASPNISAMGLTPFLVAAGVGAGSRGGTGEAQDTSTIYYTYPDVMDLLLQHGADVNAPVTGTLTYSLRVARAPSVNEGRTALHIAAQLGRSDVVRYLLAHGAKKDIADAGGRKAIDLVGGVDMSEGVKSEVKAAATANAAEVRKLLEGP